MHMLNYSAIFHLNSPGSLQKDPNEGSENFYFLKKTMPGNEWTKRKWLIAGCKRLSASPHKGFCLQNRLLEGKRGIVCIWFYLLGSQGWFASLRFFSTVPIWDKVRAKYASTRMSQGPNLLSWASKEIRWRMPRGPESPPWDKRAVMKVSVAFGNGLRKGRQWRSLSIQLIPWLRSRYIHQVWNYSRTVLSCNEFWKEEHCPSDFTACLSKKESQQSANITNFTDKKPQHTETQKGRVIQSHTA